MEEEIEAENERIKTELREEVEQERIQALQDISKQRIKQLRSIAIRFPKLANLEQNPKFKQAITQLYADASLARYTKKKRRSVEQIIEAHSPRKVLQRHQTQRLTSLDVES